MDRAGCVGRAPGDSWATCLPFPGARSWSRYRVPLARQGPLAVGLGAPLPKGPAGGSQLSSRPCTASPAACAPICAYF